MMASALMRRGPVPAIVLFMRDAGAGEARVIALSVAVAAPVDDVYGAWASSGGLAWLTRATVEPWVGGVYALDGAAGAGRVLAIAPGRLLSVEWAMPAAMPMIAAHLTMLTLTFEARRGGAWLTLTHAGFGRGPEWDEGLALHRLLWPRVLGRLKQVVEG